MSSSSSFSSFAQILNFLGSLASVTGVSLLWLKGSAEIDLATILVFALVASSTLGFVSLVFFWCRLVYLRYVKDVGFLLKIAYFFLSVPFCFIMIALVIGLINKLFLSIDSGWFFK